MQPVFILFFLASRFATLLNTLLGPTPIDTEMPVQFSMVFLMLMQNASNASGSICAKSKKASSTEYTSTQPGGSSCRMVSMTRQLRSPYK